MGNRGFNPAKGDARRRGLIPGSFTASRADPHGGFRTRSGLHPGIQYYIVSALLGGMA